MKKRTGLIYFVCAILLVGCQLNRPRETAPASLEPTKITSLPLTATTASPSTTPTETPKPTETEKPSASPTPPIPPEARLNLQCLEERLGQNANVASSGKLILENRKVIDGRYSPGKFQLDMATGEITQINRENEGGIYLSISPDRKLMAYSNHHYDAAGNVVKSELIVSNMDGDQLAVIPWEKGWYAIAGWLDNQRLIINISLLDPEESHALKAATLMVLNPFNGERQILRPDFPQIYNYSPIPDWAFWGITMYDPTLTRVVYLRISETGDYEYALWDMQKQQLLASLAYDSQLPRWSPDGSRVLVDGLPDGQTYVPGGQNTFEAFLVSRDGEVEQLTNLSAYEDMYLLSPSWSPDGRYIAAWLGSPTLRETKEAEVAILDTNTRQVTDYCIRAKYGGEGYGATPPAPIWSPDGTQLIVQDWYKKNHRRVYLVDPRRGFVAPIAEDMEPYGWMLAP